MFQTCFQFVQLKREAAKLLYVDADEQYIALEVLSDSLVAPLKKHAKKPLAAPTLELSSRSLLTLTAW